MDNGVATPAVGSGWMDEMARLLRDHGDVARFGRRVMFAHPDAVREVFTVHDRDLNVGPHVRWMRWFLGNGLLCSNGDLHRRQRAIIGPTLHPKRLAPYSAAVVRHAGALRDRWANGQVVDVHAEAVPLTLRVTADVLFSVAVGAEADSLARASALLVNAFSRRVNVRSRLGAVRFWSPGRTNLAMVGGLLRVCRTLRRFVDQRARAGQGQDDLLDRLMTAGAGDPPGRPMGRRQLLAECMTMFSAGHETTASAITFALLLLAQHPEHQATVREELDDALGDRAAPAHADLDALPFTRMAVAEAMRLFPPVYFVSRTATRPCVIAGRAVAAGDEVGLSQWVTHRDPRWWPEPSRFDPRRFTPQQVAARPRWAYFPFGGGQRTCVGEPFAWAAATLTVTTILRRWWVEPADGDAGVQLDFGISLRPAAPVRLVLRG